MSIPTLVAVNPSEPLCAGIAARVRTLQPQEQATRNDFRGIPMVIEAQNPADAGEARTLLAERGLEILDQVERHGAVLLRGFGVATGGDFEQAMLSIPQVRGMNQVFMSELGRTVIDGARFVLHTNTLYKTGGSFSPVGGFHAENYYSPDVPRYIAFFCEQPSTLGGETGVVDMAKVYEELPERIRAHLAAEACSVKSVRLAEVASRYNTTEAVALQTCHEAGLEVMEKGGHAHVCFYKPCCIKLSAINGIALVTNISGELEGLGLGKHLHEEFRADYSDAKWAMHRLAWRFSWLTLILQMVESPGAVGLVLKEMLKSAFGRIRRQPPATRLGAFGTRISEAFTPADVQSLARSMRRNFSSFHWRTGDIFILDNMRMAHAGMPGFGPRTIRAFIFNPIDIAPRAGSGLADPGALGDAPCVGEQFAALRTDGAASDGPLPREPRR
ncbi:taurine catabolism dioxygenase TauD, TfdA family protein [Collimonas fungivorans]|uniref:Taurine catabolism dioxygenase TauD, TfdA family protein n=1 Tax=Collimonas fungivorans TaxID=158899 RepID=A0A127P6A7_9BURK|nr:TauD/TfdA family dioxygenase [Collimonas fungivorans]AMO93238.1 taurine catabolism dioxygenase TauD, TfdA family protein [Collimonas fungivorans]